MDEQFNMDRLQHLANFLDGVVGCRFLGYKYHRDPMGSKTVSLTFEIPDFHRVEREGDTNESKGSDDHA